MQTAEIKVSHGTVHAIPIEKPMVLIPMNEYKFLLEEAGLTKTPHLDKRITQARARFRKNDVISWENLKNELRYLLLNFSLSLYRGVPGNGTTCVDSAKSMILSLKRRLISFVV